MQINEEFRDKGASLPEGFEALQGAWEEPGVIGTRLEIEKNRLTVLWRNAPVLKTEYTLKKTEEGCELVLQENGLRYEYSDEDYASVTSLILKDDVLEFSELFPISGPSVTRLKKTANSRYGNYTVREDILKELQGVYTDPEGFFRVSIEGDILTSNGRELKIVVLKHNDSYSPSNTYKIAAYDPALYEVLEYAWMEYSGGELKGQLMIFDAPPHVVHFKKIS